MVPTIATSPQQNPAFVMKTLLKLDNSVKLLLWNTRMYTHHQACHALSQSLGGVIDSFVAQYIAKYGNGSGTLPSYLRLKVPLIHDDGQAVDFLAYAAGFLTDNRQVFVPHVDDVELQSMFADMLRSIQQAVRLMKLQ